eukprot:scaffold896_cov250-Pinguiococcus_pyrenoidosus.AAC.7
MEDPCHTSTVNVAKHSKFSLYHFPHTLGLSEEHLNFLIDQLQKELVAIGSPPQDVLKGSGHQYDRHPWMADELASKLAADLLADPSETDQDTGVETFKVRHNLSNHAREGFLFFRPAVRRIWDDAYAQVTDEGNASYQRAVLRGNSGIGKSYSLYYVLRLALKDDRTVVLELRPQSAVYLFARCDEEYKAWKIDHAQWQPSTCCALKKEATVYIVDVEEASQSTHITTAAKGFMAPSANADHYRCWTKEDCLIYNLGTMSLRELKYIGRTLGVDEETVERRYNICGGRIRAMFQRNAVLEMVEDVRKVGMDTLIDLSGTGILSAPASHVGAPDSLIASEPERDDPRVTNLRAISPFALYLLHMRYINLLGAEVHKVAAGRILEKYAELVLVRGGTFRCFERQDVPAVEEFKLVLPAAGVQTCTQGTGQREEFLRKWKALPMVEIETTSNDASASLALLPRYREEYHDQLEQRERSEAWQRTFLTHPIKDNFPIVDAADARNRAYQITISPLEDTYLNGNRLMELLNELGTTEDDPLHLVFAVPQHQFEELLREPNFRSPLRGSKSKLTAEVKTQIQSRIREYVLCLGSLTKRCSLLRALFC